MRTSFTALCALFAVAALTACGSSATSPSAPLDEGEPMAGDEMVEMAQSDPTPDPDDPDETHSSDEASADRPRDVEPDPLDEVTLDESQTLERELHGDKWLVHNELVSWCMHETLKRAHAAGKMDDARYTEAVARLDTSLTDETQAFLDSLDNLGWDEREAAIQDKVRERMPDWTCDGFQLPPAD